MLPRRSQVGVLAHPPGQSAVPSVLATKSQVGVDAGVQALLAVVQSAWVVEVPSEHDAATSVAAPVHVSVAVPVHEAAISVAAPVHEVTDESKHAAPLVHGLLAHSLTSMSQLPPSVTVHSDANSVIKV